MSAGHLQGSLCFHSRWGKCVCVWMYCECGNAAATTKDFIPAGSSRCMFEWRKVSMGDRPLLHACVRVGDCFWFWIGMRREVEAARCRLRTGSVNLQENAAESFSFWNQNRYWLLAVRRMKLLSFLSFCCCCSGCILVIYLLLNECLERSPQTALCNVFF